jgi:hypothetical protein
VRKDKKCVIGSKAWFLGQKYSAFLNRNRGHDRHSANGLMLEKIVNKNYFENYH